MVMASTQFPRCPQYGTPEFSGLLGQEKGDYLTFYGSGSSLAGNGGWMVYLSWNIGTIPLAENKLWLALGRKWNHITIEL